MSAPSPSLLVRNTVWNGIGRVATVAIALFLTPYVIARIGQDAFGLWALSNLLVGYLSVADFGIQSSLIRQIAYARPAEDPRQLDRIVSTSVLFYLGLFALTAPLAYLAAPWITALFTVPPELHADAVFVVANASAACSDAASADPALNPNHPNHSIPVPSTTNGMFAGTCSPRASCSFRRCAPRTGCSRSSVTPTAR